MTRKKGFLSGVTSGMVELLVNVSVILLPTRHLVRSLILSNKTIQVSRLSSNKSQNRNTQTFGKPFGESQLRGKLKQKSRKIMTASVWQ